MRQKAKIVQGIEIEKAKAIVKAIKDAKLKVQASIQCDQVRVIGRSKDDLQKAMAAREGKRLRHPAAVHELPRLRRRAPIRLFFAAVTAPYSTSTSSSARAERLLELDRAEAAAGGRGAARATSSRTIKTIQDVGEHILAGGGKRLRPALLLLVVEDAALRRAIAT